MRSSFLFSLSTSALTVALAAPAAAQNAQGGNCSPTTASGSVTLNGNNCALNRGSGADGNRSSINVTGTVNTVTVTQDRQNGVSSVEILGDSNDANSLQSGLLGQASTIISGNNNSSTIEQLGTNQYANASLTGAYNRGVLAQGSDATGSIASLTISGGNIYGEAVQRSLGSEAAATSNSATFDLKNEVIGASGGAFSQQAYVSQRQNGNDARIVMRGGIANTNGSNYAAVQQRNSLFQASGSRTDYVAAAPTDGNNPATLNKADLSIAGNGQAVVVSQDGVMHFASASVSRGGVNATSSGGATQDGLAVAGDLREGNRLFISQSGRFLSVRAAVGGRDPAGLFGRGNLAGIRQGTAFVQSGSNQAGTGIAGAPNRGHSVTLYQFGSFSNVSIAQNLNIADGGVSTSPGGEQFASVADVSQSAFASTITLVQLGSNDANLNQGAPGVDTGDNLSGNNIMSVSQVDSGDVVFPCPGPCAINRARNAATTSQAGRFNTMTLRQNAVNASATLFQRRGTTNATTIVNQGISQGFGDATAPGSPPGASASLIVNVEQSGRRTTVGGITRTVSIEIRQDGTNLTANVSQNAGVNFSTGTGTSVAISQIGAQASATVTQSGSNAIATVDQRAGSVIASIAQSGGSFAATGVAANANRAIVRQFTSAGRSTSTDGGTTDTPGEGTGSRSGGQPVEAIIIQNISGATLEMDSVNSATIEQSGLGQYAEVNQNGRGNTAGILQGTGATNSVAIIRQSGNSNSFFITQESANQFYRIVQAGGGNQTVTGTGTNGGITNNGFAPVGGPVAPGGF